MFLQTLPAEVRRLKECPFRANRIRDLQSAHHRHSSVARPLGRFVALFDAMLGTAQESFGLLRLKIWVLVFTIYHCKNLFTGMVVFRILSKKTMPKTVQCCREFLSQISSTDLLLLAMMADASDEELSLLRQFDQSYLPTSDVRSLVQNFLSKIEFLFLCAGATKTGFTAYAGALVQNNNPSVNY